MYSQACRTERVGPVRSHNTSSSQGRPIASYQPSNINIASITCIGPFPDASIVPSHLSSPYKLLLKMASEKGPSILYTAC